ncbi:hypothetical protein ACS0TY_034176 [Phlomoides rotata]
MDPAAKMNPENPTAIPTPFRGLRILLLDNDTPSLLDVASKLEDYSYRVTTTEVHAIALSILQERVDQFDLVMADIKMPETECFKFIKSVHDIKKLPIILMSEELKKDMVEEAMTKGACFFLKKPISSKNLKNVWQHVYRKNKNEKSRSRMAEIKPEAEVHEKEDEQIGDSDEKDIVIGGANEKRSTEISKKRSVVPENDKAGKLKRKRREGSKSPKKISRISGESGDSTTFKELLQETDTIFCEDSHLQTTFSMRKADATQKTDLVKESGFSKGGNSLIS